MEGNYKCIGLVEKYGLKMFINTSDSGMNINSTAIKDVIEAEGTDGSEYTDLFHNMILYISTIITSIQNQRSK